MRGKQHPLWILITGCALAYGAFYTWDWRYGEWGLTPYLFALFAAFQAFSLCMVILWSIPQAFRYVLLFRNTGRAGTAGFATDNDIKRAKLFRNWWRQWKRRGFFIGAFKKRWYSALRGVFVDIESNGLYVGAAGSGKTRNFVIPIYLDKPENMIGLDYKGTLSVMTAAHRKKQFGHRIITLNPSQKYTDVLGAPDQFNPLQILLDDWQDAAKHHYVFPDAGEMALQLHPEPPHGGENFFWRNGTRKCLQFSFVFETVISGNPTPSSCLTLLSDPQALRGALEEAQHCDALSGDLATLSKDLLKKIESGKEEQFESFREGAVQSLDSYRASSTLAKSTASCSFRFADMRKKKTKMTVYVMGDSTLKTTYSKWMGWVMSSAIKELQRADGLNKIVIPFDEATNCYVEGLPSMLTELREQHIMIWIILQELQQWAHLYGMPALHTLLSQSEAKVFLGAQSPDSCDLISRYLGEETVKAISYNLGTSFFDPVTRSVSETGRKLRTPDEVRREEQMILIYKKLRPVLLKPLGYHQIDPWKFQAAINPQFRKKYRRWTRLRT